MWRNMNKSFFVITAIEMCFVVFCCLASYIFSDATSFMDAMKLLGFACFSYFAMVAFLRAVKSNISFGAYYCDLALCISAVGFVWMLVSVWKDTELFVGLALTGSLLSASLFCTFYIQ